MSEQQISEKQVKKLKKYMVYALLCILCAGAFYLIFAPSNKKAEIQGIGLNADLPDPKKDEIIGDKQNAYEQESMQQKNKDRMQSLQDIVLLGDTKQTNPSTDLLTAENQTITETQQASTAKNPINNSVSAYQDMNRTLGNFYEKPKNDPEKEELKKKLEELEAKVNEKDDKQTAMDDQLALMEKSYQLAAKYMPQNQTQNESFGDPSSENESLSKRIAKGPSATSNNGKKKIIPVRQIREQTVSALNQPMTNEELFQHYDQPRNTSFHTLEDKTNSEEKNTINAVVHGNQTLVDGQSTRIRLTESLMAGDVLIPRNTIITGIAKIQGERLDIHISSIEHEGVIIPVEMQVYDSDAQRGINIPGSLEMNATKEVIANMGNTMGTSFTVTQSTGQQVASDLSKGLIQGASQFFSKKVRQVKVTLKSGYKLMLMPK